MEKQAAIALWEKRYTYFIVHKAICGHTVGKAGYLKEDFSGWDWEYIYPLDKGGSEDEANIGLLCAFCKKARNNALEGHWSNGRSTSPSGLPFKIVEASKDANGKKIGKVA